MQPKLSAKGVEQIGATRGRLERCARSDPGCFVGRVEGQPPKLDDRIDVSDPRFRMAFSLSTVCGWVAGVFLARTSLSGEQELKVALAMVLLGGLAGRLTYWRSRKFKLSLLVICTVYVAVLGQLTDAYLRIRGWVPMPEFLAPCALASLPFFIVFGCSGNLFLINDSRHRLLGRDLRR